MDQCLMISITAGLAKKFLESFVKKYANDFSLEGSARIVDDNMVKIVVCADSQSLDGFIDMIYKNFDKYKIEDISVESFFREKDYRGIFRVISC